MELIGLPVFVIAAMQDDDWSRFSDVVMEAFGRELSTSEQVLLLRQMPYPILGNIIINGFDTVVNDEIYVYLKDRYKTT